MEHYLSMVSILNFDYFLLLLKQGWLRLNCVMGKTVGFHFNPETAYDKHILTYNGISTIPVSVEPFYGISRIDLCLF